MADLSKMSDEELMKIAEVGPEPIPAAETPDSVLTNVSDDELMSLAGIKPGQVDSVATSGLDYIKEHPFKSVLQGLPETLTGKTLQDRSIEKFGGTEKDVDMNKPGASYAKVFLKTFLAGAGGTAGDLALSPSSYLPIPGLKQAAKIKVGTTTVGRIAKNAAVGKDFGKDVKELQRLDATLANRTPLSSRGVYKKDYTPEAADVAVKAYIQAVNPSMGRFKTAKQVEEFNEKTAEGLKTITDYKDVLQFESPDGSIERRIPKSRQEGLEATGQVKEEIFKQYNTLAKMASHEEPKVNMVKIANEVLVPLETNQQIMTYKPELLPKIAKLREQVQLRGLISPQEAQADLKFINEQLHTYQQKGTFQDSDTHTMLAGIAYKLRNETDDVIEEALARGGYKDLRKRYASVKFIEQDFVKAAARQLKEGSKTPNAILDVLAGGEVLGGLLSQNPASIARGVSLAAVKRSVAWWTQPDRVVERMFEGLSKAEMKPKRLPIPKGGVSLAKQQTISRPVEIVTTEKQTTEMQKALGFTPGPKPIRRGDRLLPKPGDSDMGTGPAIRLGTAPENYGPSPDPHGFLSESKRRIKGNEGFALSSSSSAAVPYSGEKELTLKTLEKLKGRTEVSKQFIADLAKQPDLKQAEKDLIGKALQEMDGDKINVEEFANKIRGELLPLKGQIYGSAFRDEKSGDFINFDDAPADRYGGVVLNSRERGPVKEYHEHIYESPIPTHAGGIHFAKQRYGQAVSPENYFAHTRVEDMYGMDTRRVIEIQSDLFQKGNLDKEKMGYWHNLKNIPENESLPEAERLAKSFREQDIEKLKPYENIWHERIIREEIRTAAKKGFTKLQFPTGKTAMKIEGLATDNREVDERWGFGVYDQHGLGNPEYQFTKEKVKKGAIINNVDDNWIITDVVDPNTGKFKAVRVDDDTLEVYFDTTNDPIAKMDPAEVANIPLKDILESKSFKEFLADADEDGNIDFLKETFDLFNEKEFESNTIYKFYEKDVGKYLRRLNLGARRVKDEQDIEWWEIDIPKERKKMPVETFGMMGPVAAAGAAAAAGPRLIPRDKEKK